MRRVAAATVVAGCLLASFQSAEANTFGGVGSSESGDATLNLGAQIGGALSGDGPAKDVNLCTQPHSKRISNPAEHFEIDALGDDGGQFSVIRLGNKELYSAEWVTVEGVRMRAGLSYVLCEWTKKYADKKPVPPPAYEPWKGHNRYVGAYWYPIRPEPRVLIPPLFAAVQKKIGKPVLSWPNMNKENDWVFVVVPMAYQLEPIGHVRASASVENELGRASAWIEATPTRIDVESDGYASSCLIADAMEDHGTDEDPPCAVIWERVGRDVPVSVTLTWTITSSVPGADIPETVTTMTDTTIDVSEIQALVEQ